MKAPGESRNPWDLYKLAATTPGEEAFRPSPKGLRLPAQLMPDPTA
ncbi:hypothetical protein ACFQU2_04950 [Siccirubricoccus deserti]